MLVMIMQAAILIKEIDERIIALMILVDLFLWSFIDGRVDQNFSY